MDVSAEEYERTFERRNLLPTWPGKAPGTGSAWPAAEALNEAARWTAAGTFQARLVVLCGRRVARAFGVEAYPWFVWHWAVASPPPRPYRGDVPFPVVCQAVLPGGAHGLVVVPHPSGASRWWNDAYNSMRAASFWRRLVPGRRS